MGISVLTLWRLLDILWKQLCLISRRIRDLTFDCQLHPFLARNCILQPGGVNVFTAIWVSAWGNALLLQIFEVMWRCLHCKLSLARW